VNRRRADVAHALISCVPVETRLDARPLGFDTPLAGRICLPRRCRRGLNQQRRQSLQRHP
jgi:hypothetical protein